MFWIEGNGHTLRGGGGQGRGQNAPPQTEKGGREGSRVVGHIQCVSIYQTIIL